MESILSVLGSLASIGGAIWAFVQAGKSKQYATEAQLMRDEIIARRHMVEMSDIHAETKRILRTVSKVGPTCNETFIRGIRCTDIAREVEEFSRLINEQSSHFNEMFKNRARELCDELRTDIEALSEAKDFEQKKCAGKRIYYKISEFLPFVKTLTDEKKER